MPILHMDSNINLTMLDSKPIRSIALSENGIVVYRLFLTSLVRRGLSFRKFNIIRLIQRSGPISLAGITASRDKDLPYRRGYVKNFAEDPLILGKENRSSPQIDSCKEGNL